ncbi:hypothetical protein J3F84DRAFT_379225 [Trichoderma pleuroticola]
MAGGLVWCLIEFPAQRPPCLRPRVHVLVGTLGWYNVLERNPVEAFYFDENHRVLGI